MPLLILNRLKKKSTIIYINNNSLRLNSSIVLKFPEAISMISQISIK